MKVVLRITNADGDYGPTHTLEIDGKEDRHIGGLCECPEDAIIGRDLVDGEDICKYIQMGYDAAKRGETLSTDTVESEGEDDDSDDDEQEDRDN